MQIKEQVGPEELNLENVSDYIHYGIKKLKKIIIFLYFLLKNFFHHKGLMNMNLMIQLCQKSKERTWVIQY
jgi:hypothetical protein